MSNVETAIEEMIQFHIDQNDFITRADVEQYYEEQDFVCRLDAEQYTDQCVSDSTLVETQFLEDQIAELIVRLEVLEAKPAAESESESEEPVAVNQIEWVMGLGSESDSIFGGYDTMEMLEQYVVSHVSASFGRDSSRANANMVIMMVLATARNLINQKLKAES